MFSGVTSAAGTHPTSATAGRSGKARRVVVTLQGASPVSSAAA